MSNQMVPWFKRGVQVIAAQTSDQAAQAAGKHRDPDRVAEEPIGERL